MPAKILFVDDEPDQAKLMQRMFRRRIRAGELTFLFAANGEEALQVLDAEPDVDLVVSDINMPRMDGLTLLGHLTEPERMLKAVIVSAYGDMKNIRTAMNKGAFDFVTKPVDYEDLEATIEKTLVVLEQMRATDQQLRDSERVRANMSRFFSPNIAYQLTNNPDELQVGGERRDLSFVFTDLTDFTALVESSEPSAIVALLNEYLDEMTNIVFDHGGTIDKVVGDAVHAMFGAPLQQPDHARRAVHCALDMDAFGQEFAARKRVEGVPLGRTRIGVNSGAAIVGNFGGETFFDYTAHGDAINIAARLEAANKHLQTHIVVSGASVARNPDFHGRPIGSLLLKGKTDPIDVFEPLPANMPVATQYLDAFALMERADSAALPALQKLAVQYPADALVAMHLERLRSGASGALMDLR